MSYQERNTAVSLISTLLLFGFYFFNVYQMIQTGELSSANVFSLWATVIVLAIIVTIVATILINILSSVIEMARTNEEPMFIEDERDEMIGLKGTRNAHVMLGIGIFASMITLVINMPVLVMFNLLIFSAMASQIIGDLSRLYLYRRGF